MEKQTENSRAWKIMLCLTTGNLVLGNAYIEGILPKGPYLPCVSMAGRALLAGYPRYALGNWVIIGSDYGLLPVGCQAIAWTNAEILVLLLMLIRDKGIKFSEIAIKIQQMPKKKMNLKMSSTNWKWWPFCQGLNVLKSSRHWDNATEMNCTSFGPWEILMFT